MIKGLLKIVFCIFLLVGFGLFLGLFNGYITNQKNQSDILNEQLKIQRESHILNVYSTYKSNMDLCRQDAAAQKKEKEFIQANCVEALNSSVLGKSLQDWGKEDLLIIE